MNRTQTLRKLLAVGQLRRPDIDQIMGGDRVATINAMAELHMSGEMLSRRANSETQAIFMLTDAARASAFGAQA